MKRCELCNSPAKMYCESDQATLCWDCDAQVHGANFLVNKHLRTLLCHMCQSLTPWNGSGPKLCPTVSVCESCLNRGNIPNELTDHDNDDDDEDDDDDDDDDEDGGDDDDLEREDNIEEDDDDGHGDENRGDAVEEDEENQVVPWSSSPPPPASSSSTSEEGLSDSRQAFSWKRLRENTDYHRIRTFQKHTDPGCQSSLLNRMVRTRTRLADLGMLEQTKTRGSSDFDESVVAKTS